MSSKEVSLNLLPNKEKLKAWLVSGVILLVLFTSYALLAYAARGGNSWWYIDIVSGSNVLWGDDAYRYFLAGMAFSSWEIYFFSFTLPLALLVDGAWAALIDDQFGIRVIKAAGLAVSALLLYHACRRYVSSGYALLSVLVVYTLPLYIFVGISFYGESWFVFVFSVAIFLWVKDRVYWSVFVISLLPLFRVEGVYVVLAISVLSFFRKDLRMLLMANLAGGLYFFAIVFLGPGLAEFLAWRVPSEEVYASTGVWYGFRLEQLSKTLNPVMFLAALAGCLRQRNLSWMIAAALLIVSFFFILAYLEKINLEPRYLVMAMPPLAVGVAVFSGWVKEWRVHWFFSPIVGLLLPVFFVFCFSFNIKSVHFVSEVLDYFQESGKLPESIRKSPFSMSTYFNRMGEDEISDYKALADAIHDALEQHPEIKTVIISHFLVYTFLDPDRFPDDVTPVFALFGRGRLDPIMGSSLSAGYFHVHPYFSYFSLSYPNHGDELILYVDFLPLEDYPLRWMIGDYHFAIVAGEAISPEEAERLKGVPFKVY